MTVWNETMKEVERISQLKRLVFTNDKGIRISEFNITSIGTYWVFAVNGERKFILYEIGVNCTNLLDAIEKSVSDFKELEFQYSAFKKPFLKKR